MINVVCTEYCRSLLTDCYTIQDEQIRWGEEKEKQDVDCKRYDKSMIQAWFDIVIGQEEAMKTISFLVDFIGILLLRAQWHTEHRVHCSNYARTAPISPKLINIVPIDFNVAAVSEDFQLSAQFSSHACQSV